MQVVHEPMQAPDEFKALYADICNDDDTSSGVGSGTAPCSKRQSYEAMCSFVDAAVLNITTALKDTGLWNNTLLIFSGKTPLERNSLSD